GGGVLPGFGPTFVLVAAVVVPLLLWLERRTRGEFLSKAVQGQANPLAASSYGEFEVERTRFLWTAYLEIALTGPRLVWAFVDWLWGRPLVDPATRLAAAGVAVDLYAAG